MTSQVKISLWSVPVAISFLLGGLLQYLAIISPTQTNLLCLSFFLLTLIRTNNLFRLGNESLFFWLFCSIVLTYALTDSSFLSLLVYLYYLSCFAISIAAGRAYHLQRGKKRNTTTFIKIFIGFLLLQAAVTTLQNIFTDSFVDFSAVKIGQIDAIFGTLYLQSDASLGAICILFLIAAHSLKAGKKEILLINALSFIVTFNGNSSAMQAALTIISALLLLDKLPNRIKNYILIPSAILTASALILITTSDTFKHLFFSFLDLIYSEFNERSAGASAGRLAPVGHILFEDISLIGKGLLTYYNPSTKEWLYNSGPSTLYSLYIDAGLITVATFYILYFSLFRKTTLSLIEKLSVTLCLLSYSFFNFAPTDIALSFLIGLLASMLARPTRSDQT